MQKKPGEKPWSSTATQNLQAEGTGDVMQAGILFHFLVTVKVLRPKAAPLFPIGLFETS